MTLDEAITLTKACTQRLNELYRQPVFDEWAIISTLDKKGKILTYTGPRKDEFQKHFAADLGSLRSELLSTRYGLGDFEFARHGVGTQFEAFLVVGEGLFLICNNTSKSMAMIARDPLWLSAQVPFVELSDKFRSNPLVHPL
jgi:hypothetical protein